MTPPSDLERGMVAAFFSGSFPDLSDEETRFIVLRWRHMPGVFPVVVEIEPEIEWLMSRRPDPKIEALEELLARSRDRAERLKARA